MVRTLVLGAEVMFASAYPPEQRANPPMDVLEYEERLKAAWEAGERNLPVLAGLYSHWHEEVMGPWDPLRDLALPIPQTPRPWSSMGDAERMRLRYWRTALLQWPFVPTASLEAADALLSAVPMEVLIPSDEEDMNTRLSFGTQYLTRFLPILFDRDRMPQKPRTNAPQCLPNAPCSCGSGRKYKRCCGALVMG